MNVLLDTCAVLWLASGSEKLSETARSSIDGAPIAYVSVISGFEIALKHRRGKLKLPADPVDWFEQVVVHHGLEALPLEAADALRAPALPDVHRDPCDRFIIAAAARLHLPVVTADPVFEHYNVSVIN